MFTKISWANYSVIVFLLSVGYYLIIGYKYYRKDFLKLIHGKNFISGNSVYEETDQPILQSFADEVRAFIYEAGIEKLDFKGMMPSLRFLVGKYPGTKNLSMKESVQKLIIQECKTYCSIHLNEGELSEIWK